ncbi:MAG: hypothetical protein OEW70_03930 [candidate division WOR-3 bacterium]|nr:hypothetical protein [candidate division WOR-3 bacterium]
MAQLNHLENLLNTLFEKLESIKKTLPKKKIVKNNSLYGLLKGIKIPDQDIEEAKRIFNYHLTIK